MAIRLCARHDGYNLQGRPHFTHCRRVSRSDRAVYSLMSSAAIPSLHFGRSASPGKRSETEEECGIALLYF